VERTSGDVCLKISPGSYMNHTLTIKSQCMISMTIPNEVTVKMLILLCSNWSNLPTLTQKMQLASVWSTSCNIQHLVQQQGQYKMQGSMLLNGTFRHFRQANTANWQRNPHHNIINQIKARVGWRKIGSEFWELSAACDLTRSFRWRKDGKQTV